MPRGTWARRRAVVQATSPTAGSAPFDAV